MPRVKGSRRSSDIRASLTNFLIRRNYLTSANNFKLSEFASSKQSNFDSMRDNYIDKRMTNPFAISLTTVNGIKGAEKELFRFWSWISNIKNVKVKRDLMNVFLPVCIHLFVDNLKVGNKMQCVFTILSEIIRYATDTVMIELLKTLKESPLEKESDYAAVYQLFRSGRYRVSISCDSYTCLHTYLDNNAPLVIVDIMKQKIDLDVVTPVVLEDVATPSGILKSGHSHLMKVINNVSKSVDSRDFQVLTDAIKEVRQVPRNPSPVLVFALNNAESVCCGTTSPNHKYVATGNIRNEVRLWNLQAFKLPPCTITHIPLGCDFEKKSFQMTEGRYTNFRGHTGAVLDVAFHDRADLIVSVSRDSDMRVWRINDYTCAAIYSGHIRPVWCVDIGFMGMYVGTGSQDKTVRIWSLERTYPLRVLPGHTQDVNCVKFHPNGGYIASCSPDKTVRMWGVVDGSMCRLFNGHSGSVQALAFSPSGRFLASGGDGGRIKVWDIAEGKVYTDLKGNNSRVVSLDWSKDNSSLASLSSDGTVFFWRVKNGSLLASDTTFLDDATSIPSELTTGLSVQFTRRNTCVAVGIKASVPSRHR